MPTLLYTKCEFYSLLVSHMKKTGFCILLVECLFIAQCEFTKAGHNNTFEHKTFGHTSFGNETFQHTIFDNFVHPTFRRD